MKILLLDAKIFEKKEGKVFYRINYHSFNMRKYVQTIWSNGWCPVSQFKVDKDGNVYGRIANELVPEGYYDHIGVTCDDVALMNKYNEAIAEY